MSRHDFQIPVTFKHRVCFTRDAFGPDNPLLGEILAEGEGRRVLVAVEESVAKAWPELTRQIETYFADLGFDWRGIQVLPGGEAVKRDDALVRRIWETIDRQHIDRHSYLLVIGGGAFLDAVGYAAATAHRGVRLVRFPTTTLSQDDSGVGVKCAINGFGKKNWIGAFAVPFAVINDFAFLHSQDEETRRAGLIEAVKVSLVKDGAFFEWIEKHVEELAALVPAASGDLRRAIRAAPCPAHRSGRRSLRDRQQPAARLRPLGGAQARATQRLCLEPCPRGGDRGGAGYAVFGPLRAAAGKRGGAGDRCGFRPQAAALARGAGPARCQRKAAGP
jgi:hypothetical protein